MITRIVAHIDMILHRLKRTSAMVLACAALQLSLSHPASAQTFNDVPPGYWAEPFIEIVAANGITSGCGGGNYCPDGTVTRAQMAVFLERSMHGGDFVPPAATGSMFLDVGSGDFAANFIEQLANDGITGGCGGNNYCPTDSVSRAQMAVFLLRAKYGSSYLPPAPSGVFNDVDQGHWAVSWIEQLAAEGITGGCGGGAYCPDSPVQRDQMAVFLVRAFNLIIPGTGSLTLNGVAADLPLANATVTATVYDASSNWSSSTDFSTTADALGAFSLSITSSDIDDFVVLAAEGVNSQQGSKLISYAGGVGFLQSRIGDGSSTLSISDYGALEISHVTTAAGALAERAVGGPIASPAVLAEAQTKIVGAELLEMAAAIKAYVDNPEISLPAGVGDSLELVRDPFEFSGFVANLETSFPILLNAATTGVADTLQQGFTPSDVPGTRLLVQRDNVPLYAFSYALVLAADTTGQVVLYNGSSDATWAISANGSLVVNLLTPPVTETFPYDPNSPTGQIRALEYIDRLTIERLAQGLASEQVVALARVITEYPDNPERPNESVEQVMTAENVMLGTRPEEAQRFATSEIAGAKIAIPYFHQDNDTTASSNAQIGADFFTFNANGTGITSRRLYTFVWNIDNDGAINIRFANGDENRVVRYSKDNIVNQTVVLGALADGSRKVFNAELIEYDGISNFSEVMLLNRRYRNLASIIEQEFNFDFLFLPGGTGCRIFEQDGSQSTNNLTWTSTAADAMDSYRYHPSEPTVALQRRSWELIAIETGQFGDRYWVIENLDHNSGFPLPYTFMDPTTTPGRMNAYEFIQDLTGQANPCGF